jgi:putative salt-induced outer membrane protein
MKTLRSFFTASMLLVVATASLQAQAAAPPAKVDSLEGQASAGLAFTSGNSNATTFDISDKLKYTKRGWSFGQDLKYFYGEADDKVTADFWNTGLRVDRRLMKRLGMFVLARWDRNVLQGIASRFEESIGLDFLAIDAPRDKLIFTAGASAFQQELTPGSTSTFKGNYPAARLAGDYKHSFTDKAYFQQTVEYLPNLSETEAYLINGETTLVAPLIANLGLKVSSVIRYNSQPPTRDGVRLKTTDRFLSSGITYSF